ncbi:UNVERIFIED_CONTAM: hypothetical protein PYX00_001340 [Menopon gallinae]|uniref:Apterous n=1 Tax=Menopon gallinae TaxID=328185 RepID=A0AAW2ICT3_9NEOP
MDRYYLLAVDRQWHSPCLKCCECKLPLDTELTCFARDGNIYCKEDYYRLFAIKRCNRCQTGISASELVMRAKDMVYHLNCFTCASCGIPLSKGDHFGMRNGLVYCHPHYELLCSHDPYCGDLDNVFRAGGSPADFFASGGGNVQKGRPRKRKLQAPIDASPGSELNVSLRLPTATLDMLHPSDLSSSMESIAYEGSIAGSPGQQNQQSTRTKRMRTSFKHHQLRTMKSYFAINQNPDAKDLKQLAQKTGLSKRVLQVWFQNARAKWRRNLMRQETGQSQHTNSIDCPPSVGPVSVLMGENNNSMQSQIMDDIHHMHHQQGQAPNFSDIY